MDPYVVAPVSTPKPSGLLASSPLKLFAGLLAAIILVLYVGVGWNKGEDLTVHHDNPQSAEYVNALKRSKNALHPILETHPQHWQIFMDWRKRKLNSTTKGHSESNSSLFPNLIDDNEAKAVLKNVTYVQIRPPNSTQYLRKHPIKPEETSQPEQPHPLPEKKLKEGNYIYPNAHQRPAYLQNDPITVTPKIQEYMMNCKNQTLCVPPLLQLDKTFNVYYCKHLHYGVRFYYLAREGLILHPRLNLVYDMEQADYIVYLPESSRWDKTECNNPKYYSKLVILDESDYPHVFEEGQSDKFFLLFKRSYVQRQDGHFKGYMSYLKNMQVLPMTYPVAEAYLKPKYNPIASRPLEIVCSLRGSPADPTRKRVRQLVENYGRLRNITNIIAGEINHASRTVISKQYFEQMYNAKIVITSNPSHWEGDFRFGEALASGALIFIDHMYVPRPHRFRDHQHIFYYDSHSPDELYDKLDAIRSDVQKMQQIALQGYIHALTYHRAINLLDYIFRTVYIKELALKHNVYSDLNHNVQVMLSEKHWQYTEHGYLMRYQALQRQITFEKYITKKHKGQYPTVVNTTHAHPEHRDAAK